MRTPRLRVRRDYTTGSVPKNLFHLAWPQATEGIFNVADQATDLLWAGRLEGGFHAMAGVSIVQAWVMFAFMVRQGVDTAMRAMVARALGARDAKLANHVALQAVTVALIYSVLAVGVGILLAEPLMAIVGASEEIRAQALLYMQLQFVFLGLVSMRQMLASALQASGDPVTALKSTAVTRGLHMALSPLFMFGLLGFPEMGLAGAAMANMVGQLCGLALNSYALFRGNTQLRLTLKGYRVDLPLWRRLLVLGYPASLSGMERGISQLILLRVVTPFGDVATAVFGVMRRMEIIGNFGSMGVGAASGILVGHNLGAGQPARARAAVRWGVGYVAAAQVVTTALFLLVPVLFLRIFTGNAEVLGLGSDWLRIQAFAFALMSVGAVYQQSFNTAGDTMTPMVAMMTSMWLVELPLAWAFAHWLGIGPLGLAYAGICAMGARLFFYVPYYFSDRWLRVKVL